jgi:hypothetical protein
MRSLLCPAPIIPRALNNTILEDFDVGYSVFPSEEKRHEVFEGVIGRKVGLETLFDNDTL